MHGTIAVTLLSPATESVSFNLTIDVNDVPWIRIRGIDNGVTVVHADGTQLSPAEEEAFLDLFGLSVSCANAMSSLFGPPGTLMGA